MGRAGLDAAAFTAVLDREPKDKLFRAQWQLDRTAFLLRLSRAATSYEYLQAGERQRVKNWKGFVHVPDISAEREVARRKRAEAAALELETRRVAPTHGNG